MSTAFVWLPGWSFGDDAFEGLRSQLPPSIRHYAANFLDAVDANSFYATAAAVVHEARQQHLSGDNVIAVGWSLGGMLALRLAAEGLIDGAVAIAAAPQFIRDACDIRSGQQGGASAARGWDARHLKRMQKALAADRQEVEQRFRSIALAGAAEANVGDAWSNEALHAGLNLLLEEDLRPLLPSIRCPLLLIHGVMDSVCDVSASDRIRAAVPHAEALTLDYAGHAPHLAAETLTADRIRRWLHAWHS